MVALVGYLNKLLPFATPGTPLIQDLAHLFAVCTLLYFAPQIQERFQKATEPNQGHQEEPGADNETDEPEAANVDQHAEDHVQQNGAEAGFNHREAPPNAPDANQDDEDEDPEPGPANPAAAPRALPAERNVGAKKLKSLQRRDQRRAYHEFQRSQGEAQRARDAEGAEEREAALAAERERRKAREAELKAREAKERAGRKEAERKEREGELARREMAVGIVRRGLEERGMCSLWSVADQVGGDVDAEWVEKVLKVAGVVDGGRKAGDGALTMVTGKGWVVRVTEEDVRAVYERATREKIGDAEGRIDMGQIGGLLTAHLESKAEQNH